MLPNELDQLTSCPLGNYLAVVDDADALAQALCLFHVVGRVQNGHALGAERLDALEDRVATLGVHAHRWLVED